MIGLHTNYSNTKIKMPLTWTTHYYSCKKMNLWSFPGRTLCLLL